MCTVTHWCSFIFQPAGRRARTTEITVWLLAQRKTRESAFNEEEYNEPTVAANDVLWSTVSECF